MRSANLIPASRRQARTSRGRVKLWTAIGVSCAALIIGSATTAQLYLSSQYHNAAADLDAENARIKQLMTDSVTLRKQLTEAISLRQSVREVTDQPDWSIVLTALAAFGGDETVLREVKLHPLDDKVAAVALTAKTNVKAQTAPASKRFTLDIKGLSKSQPAVAKFVMALQQSDIFEEVKLVRTGREPFLDDIAVVFDLECTMGDARR